MSLSRGETSAESVDATGVSILAAAIWDGVQRIIEEFRTCKRCGGVAEESCCELKLGRRGCKQSEMVARLTMRR